MKRVPCLLLASILFLNCGKEKTVTSENPNESSTPTNEISLPEVKTLEVTDVSSSKAQIIAQVVSHGGNAVTQRGFCYATHSDPTIEDKIVSPNVFAGNGNFKGDIIGLIGGTKYYVRGFAKNAKGVAYGEVKEFTADTYSNAEISQASLTFYTMQDVQAKASITNSGGAEVIEAGICYSTKTAPTVNDNVVRPSEIVNNTFNVDLTGLNLGTSYYVRSYVKTLKGTFYGSQTTLQTYTKGKITVNYYNQSAIPTDVMNRFQTMVAKAVSILEEHTSIVKTVTIEYNTGVATADATLAGWIRFGSNSSYQRAGTFLHEFAHAIGGGTSTFWTTIMKSGVYTGANATLALRRAAGDNSLILKGDSQHFWPYGINGANEDTGLDSDYIITALIIEGFKRDGAPIK